MEKLPQIIHESWHPFLQPIFDYDFGLKLVKNQVLSKPFYPAKENIFRIFSMPMQNIKVVILGQDPYINKGQANGYAFAVNEDCPMPASLQIIAKEIELEGLKSGFYDSDIPHWRTLESWVEQGVFLLNTALTVAPRISNSHLDFWSSFTRQVIKIIAKEIHPIWALWGRKAQAFIPFINGNENENWNNHVFYAPHPAAEAYANGTAGFYYCGHFKAINQALSNKNQTIINW